MSRDLLKCISWSQVRLSMLAIAVAQMLVASTGPFHAANAQANLCGESPLLRDERLKGELDSKASVLSRFVGDLRFKGQVEIEKSEVLSRYPNADKLMVNQYYMYQVCILIMSDARMGTEKKFELLTNAREAIFNPSAERKTWLTPESLKLSVDGFYINRNAEYNGVLNFSIDNRSGNDLGIGILTNAATAGGCSGDTNVVGLPLVAPAGTMAAATGTIFMDMLKRAPDPAKLLRWFPAGARLSATIRWFLCSAGMASGTATVPVVLARGRDVLELSLNSGQR